MAENRLFQMVYLLLERGTMTASELAKHYEVSVRTIYRDIDTLSAAGIPVYAISGKGGGISIEESFVLNKSLVSEKEQEQIMMALQGIQMVDNENTSALFTKLSSIFQKRSTNWIEVDFYDWQPSHRSLFNSIKTAIFESKKVSFLYYSNKGETTHRIVEPLKLVFKSKNWFLYGYCQLRDDYRLFKLTRIKEFEITSETFKREAPDKIFDEKEFDLEMISITLLFDESMAYYIYDIFEEVTQQEDGRFLVQIEMPNNEFLYNNLLSYGDKAEVVGPESIREKFKKYLKNIQDKY